MIFTITFISTFIQGFGTILQTLAAALLVLVCEAVNLDVLTPSLDKFASIFGDAYDQITQIFASTALIVFGLIVGVTLVSTMISGARGELKENFMQFLVRLVVSAALMFVIPSFLNQTMKVANRLDDKIEAVAGTYDSIKLSSKNSDSTWIGSLKDAGNKILLGIEDTDNDGKADTDSFTLETFTNAAASAMTFPTDFAIGVVWGIICLFANTLCLIVVTYSVMKIVIEVIQKYVTMVFLYLFSPVFSGFFVSITTESIFFSWIKMAMVSMFVLVFNRFWVTLCIFLIQNMKMSLFATFFIIAVTKFWTTIEQQLNKAGLSAAATGSSLLDTFSITAMAATRAVSGAFHGAAGVAAQGAAFAGATKLAGFMNGLNGGGFGTSATASFMNNSAGGLARSALDRAGVKAFEPTQSQKDLAAKMPNRGYRDFTELQKSLANMNPESRKEMLNYMANSMTGKNGQSFADALNAGGFKNLQVDGVSKDGIFGSMEMWGKGENGELENLGKASFTTTAYPVDEYSIPFKTANGDDAYMNFKDPECAIPMDGGIYSVGDMVDRSSMDYVEGFDAFHAATGISAEEAANRCGFSDGIETMGLSKSDDGFFIHDTKNSNAIRGEIKEDGTFTVRPAVFDKGKDGCEDIKKLFQSGALNYSGVNLHTPDESFASQAKDVKYDETTNTYSFDMPSIGDEKGKSYTRYIVADPTQKIPVEHASFAKTTLDTPTGSYCVMSKKMHVQKENFTNEKTQLADNLVRNAKADLPTRK